MKNAAKRDSPLGDESLFILAVLVIGLSGIVAQVILLRELLVSFYGNELTIGVILTSWILSEALGVFILGKFIDRIKNKPDVFIMLQVLFSLVLPVSMYLARAFKSILGVPFGEGIGLTTIFFASLLSILPIGFCHGALFSAGCRIYSGYLKKPASAIGKIYTWETIGTVIGGIALTYLFIPRFNSFQIAFIISLSNLLLCLLFFKGASKRLRYITLAGLALALSLTLLGGVNKLQLNSIARQWRSQEVLDYRNSIYGNVVVTRKEEQTTFFYNGLPIITAPYPDITFVEEFGNIPLLFHPHPDDILVIGGGAGGLIREMLNHPVKNIDYAELDPLIIEMLRKYPTSLTEEELNDQRVKIINTDSRFFIKNTAKQYDIALLGLSKPADLSSNRIFTREFFALAKKRLKPEGLLAFYLPGSLTYLSNDLRDLNACILNGLKTAFAFVRVIPGDYNIFLASDIGDILKVDADLIRQRISERKIENTIFIPTYLDYRLNPKWIEWFNKSLADATKRINQDLRPFALFETLVLWNKQFSKGLADIFASLKNLNLTAIFILLFCLTLILCYLIYRKPDLSKLTVAYSIGTTGFFGMLANLIFIFSFQVAYGYLYHQIGLLMSIFMAGIAAGSIFITGRAEKIKNSLRLFIGIEAGMILFTYLFAWVILGLAKAEPFSSLIFLALFFISGLFLGLEFPLASKMYLKNEKQIGAVSGLLYGADLIGGSLAGLFGAIIFLPVLGLFNTCVVIICVKLSSLLLLVVFGKRLTKIII